MSRKRRKKLPPGDASKSPCPHFPDCGGCFYLGLPIAEVLAKKEAEVLTALEDAMTTDTVWEGIRSSPSLFSYRNKMEFSFGDERFAGPLSLGMHKRGSFYDVVSVPACQIVDEDYRKIVQAVCAFFAPYHETGSIQYYHRKKQRGYLRHLLVRKALHTEELLIVLVTNAYEKRCWDAVPAAPTEQSLLQAFTDLLLSLPLQGAIAGILHTVNESVSDAIKDGGTTILYGRDEIREEVLNLQFKITPFSFFQTNTASAEVLYDTVRLYVKDALKKMGKEGVGVLYDLYSGTGTITQLMADTASHCVGVELVEEAVEAAKENALLNGLTNCAFIAGDVLSVLDDLKEPPDFIILDPPREGVNAKALRKILSYGVPYIVYVSCKVASLQRDSVYFREAGYTMTRGMCLDQFPWTEHFECVVLLSRVEDEERADYGAPYRET